VLRQSGVRKFFSIAPLSKTKVATKSIPDWILGLFERKSGSMSKFARSAPERIAKFGTSKAQITLPYDPKLKRLPTSGYSKPAEDKKRKLFAK